MKQKLNAKQKRTIEALRKKELFSLVKNQATNSKLKNGSSHNPVVLSTEKHTDLISKEETFEFLEYLDKYGVPEYILASEKRPGNRSLRTEIIPGLNLKDGMPVVAEALDRMHAGLLEMRYSRVKAVKLIHGYGSTGRGGKIRIGVLNELADLKRKKQIKDYVPGEDFGPIDQVSRNLVDQNRNICHDPDYGNMNHGITIVILS